MKLFVCALLTIALLGACQLQRASVPVARVSVGQAMEPQVSGSGLDLAALDTTIRPGDDFFLYANGRWLKSLEIPQDQSSYSAFEAVEEIADERVRTIIEDAAKGNPRPGSPLQQIGDFYAAFTDLPGIEARGLEPIKGDLARIASARTIDDIAALFGAPGFVSPFEIGFPPDFKDPSRYSVFIVQAGLGLPDRDYYLKADRQLRSVRDKYASYIAQMLRMTGLPSPLSRAQRVLRFETEIARVEWPIDEQRQVEKTYNPRTLSEIASYARGFPWRTFLASEQLADRDRYVLGEITAIRDIAALIGRTPVATLRDYLTFHCVSDLAPELPKRFDDAHFALFGNVLRGEPQERERWRRGVDAVSDSLGEAVGQLYVAQYFPAQSKARMQALVDTLLASLSDRLDSNGWMTPGTRAKAHEKLASFVVKVGYPDQWKDYSGLEVRRDDPVGNVRRALTWEMQRQRARLDLPVDRGEWQMNVHQVNAYYNPLNNEIVFPAAILQAPFFNPAADAAVNFGAIGAIIGHEIGHGFDDQGRKFDAAGRLVDWWTPQDAAAFTRRTRRLIEEYSGFEALPGLKLKGANTIGENIGDLGGLNMAYHAYQLSLQGKPAPVIDGLTGDQRFFLSWAQVWRTKLRNDDLRNDVLTDVHSPAYFRVNGPLPNVDAWYLAFQVQPGDKLYLKPADRVEIW